MSSDTYDKYDKITTQTYPSGKVIGYGYDSKGELVSMSIDGTPFISNIKTNDNGVKTYFIYDGHMLIGEYKLNLSNDSRQEYVYLNSTPIATITPQENYRVYADHLETSRRVATNNEEATIVWKWESKPFGESKATGDITFNLRFPGQYFDGETSTHYNINRDYNPVTGRYIQSDPIGFDGGVNGFGYVGGNPILYIDPNGKWLIFAGASYVGVVPGLIGFNTQMGIFWDVTKDTYGVYTSNGFSIGIDNSVGGVAGFIYGDDAFSKFQGPSRSVNIGFGIFTQTKIESMYGDNIGYAFGLDFGPLPASATIDFSYNKILLNLNGSQIRNFLNGRMNEIYDEM